MKLYFIAGEASGDMHSANLVKEIRKRKPEIKIRGWGGDLMEKEGAEIVMHYRDLAFMGFTEVIKNLRTILRNISFCKKDILQFKPDAVVLVDYPGFNLRIAEFAKEHSIPVYYYISPQVWAWKSSRVKKIREVVNKMYVILPFEKDFYKKYNYDVEYVGHPLKDVIAEKSQSFLTLTEFQNKYGLADKPIISVLPGSRRQEISEMLPLMLSVIKDFTAYQFVIAGAPSIPESVYKSFTNGKSVRVIHDNTHQLIYHSKAALVTSGTATLETALLNVPEVVCYKGGRISYMIAKKLVKIRFISLVNLIMDSEIVKELIQDELTTLNIKNELNKILDEDNRKRILSDYLALSKKLNTGGASSTTAEGILNDLKLQSIF